MLGMCQLKQKRDSPETPGNAPAFRRHCSSLSRFPDQVHSEEDGHRQQEPEQLLVSGDLEIGQWLFLVPFIGGRFHLYTTYILPIGWLYATYQLLREPGNSYWIGGHPLKSRYTPWKINMEPENDGLEEEFSFSIGWFLGSMLIFRGVPSLKLTARKNSWKFHGWKRILSGEGMLYQNFRISPFDPDSLKWITSWTLNINLCRASIVQFFEGKTISLRKDVIIDSFFKRQHLLGLWKSYCITTRSKQTPWITLWMIFREKNNATWIPIKVVHCGSKMASLIHQKISFSNCFYSPWMNHLRRLKDLMLITCWWITCWWITCWWITCWWITLINKINLDASTCSGLKLQFSSSQSQDQFDAKCGGVCWFQKSGVCWTYGKQGWF